MLEQSNHRQHQPHDRDIATGDKRFAECSDYRERTKPAGNSGREARGRDDEEGIDAEGESNDDDEYAYECEQSRLQRVSTRVTCAVKVRSTTPCLQEPDVTRPAFGASFTDGARPPSEPAALLF